jgi:ELWxxDGT repeat protein
MEKGSINSLLVVLMLIAVGGFAILSDNGSNTDSSSDDGESQQMEDEWDVYYVDSGDDLPNCNSETLGRLYYVASIATFEVCLTSGWSFIDIKGADGEQGPPGEQGPAGADGANGTNGINGQDGTNGQDGSASPNTMLTSISDTDSTVQCIAGGRIIVHGLDNGDEGGVSQNGILEPGEIDYTTSYCSNFVVSRISDVNPTMENNVFKRAAVMETRLYFMSGNELWVHESINGSTWQVTDNDLDGGMGLPWSLTVLGERVYFVDGYNGTGMWVHDRSNESTWQLFPYGTRTMFETQGTKIFFYAQNPINGTTEFWVHETTNDSSWKLFDDVMCAWPKIIDTRIYCKGYLADDSHNMQLWIYDTTNQSIWQATNINSNGSWPSGFFSMGGVGYESELIEIGTRLFFNGNDGIHGVELWAYETTNDSTWLVKDINNGSVSGLHRTGENMVAVGTQLYFSAYESTGNGFTTIESYGLYVHETNNGSTWKVADLVNRVVSLNLFGSLLIFESDGSLTVHDTVGNYTWEIIESSELRNFGEDGIFVVDDLIYFEGYDSDLGTGLYMMEIGHAISYN